MDPTTRYELRLGEWREDPPHVRYGCDRTGLVAALGDGLGAAPWTQGESEAGPVVEVGGRTLGCPAGSDDLEWLMGLATAAPYGRGERTVLDRAVRDARQVQARHVSLRGAAWDALRAQMLETVAADIGLADAALGLEFHKLLVYPAGGHFAEHTDTEKSPGMVASVSLIVPGEHEGGASRRARGEDGGHGGRGLASVVLGRVVRRLPPSRGAGRGTEVRIALTFGVVLDPGQPLARREASSARTGWTLWDRSYAERHTAWAARTGRIRAGSEQYGQKTVWVLSHRCTAAPSRGSAGVSSRDATVSSPGCSSTRRTRKRATSRGFRSGRWARRAPRRGRAGAATRPHGTSSRTSRTTILRPRRCDGQATRRRTESCTGIPPSCTSTRWQGRTRGSRACGRSTGKPSTMARSRSSTASSRRRGRFRTRCRTERGCTKRRGTRGRRWSFDTTPRCSPCGGATR